MKRRSLRFLLCFFLGFLLVLSPFTPILAINPPTAPETEGQALYESRQFQDAIERWNSALKRAEKENDPLARARILGNLALAYRQIGAWAEAERAIAESIAILEKEPKNTESVEIMARTLNNRGLIELARGQAPKALESWETANALYRSIDDRIGVFQSRVNQALALKVLGSYPLACENLAAVLNLPDRICRNFPERVSIERWKQELQALPPFLDGRQLTAWRILAEVLELSGKNEAASVLFTELLSRTDDPRERSRLYLSLGNAASGRGNHVAALDWYDKAIETARDPLTRVQGDLGRLKIYLATGQGERAIEGIPSLKKAIELLPLDRDKIAAEINLAASLRQLRDLGNDPAIPGLVEIARILAGAGESAGQVGAVRLESLALGELGGIYESEGRYDIARSLTEQALAIAAAHNAPELAYRWQWQLGRILAARGERQQAIAAYTLAVETLKSIEGDLASGDRDTRFSFRERVEPVYRQLVSLLLQPDRQGQIPPEAIEKARNVIESLRIAELNNFFRENCLETHPRSVETIDPGAAIIYPIVLSDRLAVILALPGRPLHYYSAPVTAKELEKTVREFRYHLVVRSRRDFYPPGRDIYRWLIEPIEARLKENQIETLVFVPDGALRNVPMSALFDGKQFLIEKYRIALNPGLEILDPDKLQRRGFSTLAAGLTRERDGFPPLYHVVDELKTIRENVNSDILLDEAFTIEGLKAGILDFPAPIVHIATHGQFSSNLDDTFLLAWDGPIDVGQLDRLLRSREEAGERAIELLVLSACETAAGDDRAALGLAGIAVRSGARSTVATLWPVNDEATSEFMNAFYRGLINEKFTRAEALRQAQLKLLENPKFRHPFYWSPYILLGNWL
ncbi:CHAT domain-containing protein [Pannus brasiliensis CCIBt3594]|uniref:CHAT domain-containing protein n=1 Tax=Pannus brasiliensis CCIBt3594 TaxID=1427578 RepID=A0AAW9QEY7_9CHRO